MFAQRRRVISAFCSANRIRMWLMVTVFSYASQVPDDPGGLTLQDVVQVLAGR